MNFLTEELKEKLLENGRPGNRDKDHAAVVKLFIPGTRCTWLLSELDYEQPDIAFGLCDLGMGFPELGSVSLTELNDAGTSLGIRVIRDQYFEPVYPMSVYAFAANVHQAITDDREALKEASEQLQQRNQRNGPKPE